MASVRFEKRLCCHLLVAWRVSGVTPVRAALATEVTCSNDPFTPNDSRSRLTRVSESKLGAMFQEDWDSIFSTLDDTKDRFHKSIL